MANREIPQENQELTILFTKRKLANDLSISVAVGVFIGYLAPFGMDKLPVYLSIFYWVFTCICGYFIYTPLIHFANLFLEEKITVHWHRVAIATLFASMLMSFAVPIITWLFFNEPIEFAKQVTQVFPKAIVIGGVITFISLVRDFIKQQKEQLAASEKVIAQQEVQVSEVINQQVEQFIGQLPLEKRGELLCLEMSDHYLKIYTDKGHHMVLMRFKDALAQLDEFPGIQTHRSWWVSIAAIQSSKKENRKMTLQLVNGIEVPVSRTYEERVKTEINS